MPHSFPLRARPLMAALLLSLSAVAAPVRAVEVPDAAVTPDTTLVVWVDARAIDQFCQGVASLQADVPSDKKNEAEAFLQAIMKYRQAFKAWGGEGILIVATVKDLQKSGPSHTDADGFFLLKAKAGADPAAFEKELHAMAVTAKNPELKKALSSTKITAYGTGGWYAVTDPSLPVPPQKGSAKDAAVFNMELKSVEKSPVQLYFRMLPAMRSELLAQLNAPERHPDGGKMDVTESLLAPLAKLDGVIASGDLAQDAEQAGITMHFADAAGAADFAASFNGLLQMGKGMAAMQTAKWSKYGVDVQNVNAIMDQVAFKADQGNAAMKLDSAFFARCRTLIRQMQVMQAKAKADLPPAAGHQKKAAD